MCGIAGFYLKTPDAISAFQVDKLSDELLFGINHRGGDATGFAALIENDIVPSRIQAVKGTCDAKVFIRERPQISRGARAVILHTRFATQGHEAFAENNHPVNCDGVYVVHNGHIYNDRAVCGMHGFKRIGEVDSEAIAHAIAGHGWAAPKDALESLDGAMAIGAINLNNGELMIARGYSSPLFYVETENLMVFASTRFALTTAWSRALGTPPKDKRIKEMKEGRYRIYNGAQIDTGEFWTGYHPVVKYSGVINTWKTEGGTWANGIFTPHATKALTVGQTIAAKFEENGEEIDHIPGVTVTEMTEQMATCDGCGDYFFADELWELWHGYSVCQGCETRFGDELPGSRTNAADILASMDR